MKITVLGWGSLVWDLQGLPVRGDWTKGGPTLPLEFSRISQKTRFGALTLVIDPSVGEHCSSRFVQSARDRIDEAIHDLRTREGTERIGYVDLARQKQNSRTPAAITSSIAEWARANRWDAVVWADLASNFQRTTGQPFSVANALSYLRQLDSRGAQAAREYLLKAPPETNTPLRRAVHADGWLSA